MTRKLFSAALILSFSAICRGQDEFMTERFSTENGLPSNSINGILWDKETKFLWIATEAGLCRFNGTSFKLFVRKYSNDDISPRMKFIARTYEGKIISANKLYKIFEVKNNNVEYRNNISGVKISAENAFLLKTSEKLLMNPGPIPRSFRGLRDDVTIVPVNDTISYLLSKDSLFRYSPSGGRMVDNMESQGALINLFRVGAELFVRDRSGHCFGFNPLSGKSRPVEMLYPAMSTRREAMTDFPVYWENGMENPVMIHEGKAYLINEKKGRLITEFFSAGIPENTFINHIQFSRENHILFVSTISKGLIVIRSRFMKQVRKKKTSINESTSYYGQTQLPDGSILTNAGHIIDKANPANEKSRKFPAGYFSLFRTSPGDLYYVWDAPQIDRHIMGHFRWPGEKVKYYDVDFDNNTAIGEDRGAIYILNRKGLCKFQKDRFDYLFQWNDPINTIYSVEPKEPGILVLTTCKGLFQFDLVKNRLDTLLTTGEFCIRTSRIIGKDLLVGTYGKGIYLLRNNKTYALPLDKNKYLQFAHCFIPDSMGFIWISTNRGIFRCRQSDLTEAADRNTDVFYQFYGEPDGLEMTEMNGGCYPCAIRLKSGHFSFPSMDGLVWFSPEKAEAALDHYSIFIDELNIGDQTVIPHHDEIIEIPHSAGELIIHLGYPAWCKQENIYIEYRLNNEEEWKLMRIENENSIRLTNLPPGNYELQIRLRNGFGKGKYAYQSLAFIMNAPWYMNYWAYGIGALALWGLVVLFIRIKIRRQEVLRLKLESQVAEKTRELQYKNEELEKRNNLKSRLISIISHDIITPLKFVSVAGRKLLEKKHVMPEDMQKETIQEMTDTSRELQLLSTNILNWIKYVNENLRISKDQFHPYDSARQNAKLLESIAGSKNIRLQIDMEPAVSIRQYEEPVRILMYNLMLNAINFSDKGTVSVSGRVSGNQFTLSIRDEGVGMTPDQINNIMADEFIISSANVDKRKGNGLGYLIIKDLLKIIKGDIHISSESGKGTSVTVTFDAA